MQRVLSTYLFVNRKLTPALLDEIERAGITAVELFCSRAHLDYRSQQDVRELADWFATHSLKVHALHAPTERDLGPGRESGLPISIAETERVRRLDAVDEIKRALEVADSIPFRYLVQHVGSSRDPDDPRRWQAAFSSLEHLHIFAKERGVTIALENTPGELATPANLRHFIADTRLHDLRLCFDTGHAHMEEGVQLSFETMRELVATTHVHDNHGEKDEHLFPYEGTINWNATLQALASVGQDSDAGGTPLVLELRDHGTHRQPLEQVSAVFEKFQRELAGES